MRWWIIPYYTIFQCTIERVVSGFPNELKDIYLKKKKNIKKGEKRKYYLVYGNK